MGAMVGSRLGPYEIVEQIGAGGMGEVYRARDPRLGRDVAVKVLPQRRHRRTRPGWPASSRRRARSPALSHPNLLAIFDVGTGDVPYLVTELLDGETLRVAARTRPARPGRRDRPRRCSSPPGSAAAHARGVVHRDLKPDNIFVTADGRAEDPRLRPRHHGGGRGGRRQRQHRDHRGFHTLPGLVLGTLGYLSPEQARARPVDHRADIFACGAVLYEMLTGQRAFRGESPADTIALVLHRPPSELFFGADVAPGLAAAVRRCLEQEPGRRFQSAHDLALALESISHDGTRPVGIAVTPPPGSVAVLPFVQPRRRRRRPVLQRRAGRGSRQRAGPAAGLARRLAHLVVPLPRPRARRARRRARAGRRRRARGQRAALGDAAAAHRAPHQRGRRVPHLVGALRPRAGRRVRGPGRGGEGHRRRHRAGARRRRRATRCAAPPPTLTPTTSISRAATCGTSARRRSSARRSPASRAPSRSTTASPRPTPASPTAIRSCASMAGCRRRRRSPRRSRR